MREWKHSFDVLLLWCFVCAGVIMASFLGAKRWAVEVSNRTVAIVLDCDELQRLSSLSGKSLRYVLHQFKGAGATGVAITEMKLSDLLSSGNVTILPKGSFLAATECVGYLEDKLCSDSILLSSDDYALLRAMYSALKARIGSNRYRLIPLGDVAILIADVMLLRIGSEGLGINPRLTATVRAAGLSVIARLSNTQHLTDTWLNYVIGQARSNGASLLIFDGEEVLGYRERITDVVEALSKNGLLAATIEFAKQRGEERLSNGLDGAIVRVHSISKQEMALRTPDELIRRFVRAVLERNVRVCYVRLPATATRDALSNAVTFVNRLGRALVSKGFTLGIPKPFSQPMSNGYFRFCAIAIISVAAVAGFILLLSLLLQLDARSRVVAFLAGSTLSVMFSIVFQTLWTLLCALAVALTFPTLAVCLITQLHYGQTRVGESDGWEYIVSATAKFALCSAVTICGGILIVGLLCDRRFMVVAQQFRGVKLSQILPMLILAVLLVSGWLSGGNDLRSRLENSQRRLKDIFSSPVLWWHAMLSILILAAGAYWIVRTGNIAVEAVPSWELKLRELLERTLIVRPRFKEAFIGHPALITALGLIELGRVQASMPLMLVGFIGQLSMLNTFTHIHTPLFVSFLRVAHALWIGWLIGVVALFLIKVAMARVPKG